MLDRAAERVADYGIPWRERQEFERVIATIMGEGRECPEVLKRVMAERALCSA